MAVILHQLYGEVWTGVGVVEIDVRGVILHDVHFGVNTLHREEVKNRKKLVKKKGGHVM